MTYEFCVVRSVSIHEGNKNRVHALGSLGRIGEFNKDLVNEFLRDRGFGQQNKPYPTILESEARRVRGVGLVHIIKIAFQPNTYSNNHLLNGEVEVQTICHLAPGGVAAANSIHVKPTDKSSHPFVRALSDYLETQHTSMNVLIYDRE